MADGMRVSFEVTGLGSVLAQLREISDPRKLEKTTRESMGRSAAKVIAPRLAKAGGWKYGGHGGRYPTKGLLGERRRITARRLKTRPGEYVAIGVKPRGWAGTVEAWVVKGTKPHIIRARGAGQSGTDSDARSINRLARGEYRTTASKTAAALVFLGTYRTQVRHPGAEPRDYIREAITPDLEHQIVQQLERDIFAAIERAKRKAGPK